MLQKNSCIRNTIYIAYINFILKKGYTIWFNPACTIGWGWEGGGTLRGGGAEEIPENFLQNLNKMTASFELNTHTHPERGVGVVGTKQGGTVKLVFSLVPHPLSFPLPPLPPSAPRGIEILITCRLSTELTTSLVNFNLHSSANKSLFCRLQNFSLRNLEVDLVFFSRDQCLNLPRLDHVKLLPFFFAPDSKGLPGFIETKCAKNLLSIKKSTELYMNFKNRPKNGLPSEWCWLLPRGVLSRYVSNFYSILFLRYLFQNMLGYKQLA